MSRPKFNLDGRLDALEEQLREQSEQPSALSKEVRTAFLEALTPEQRTTFELLLEEHQAREYPAGARRMLLGMRRKMARAQTRSKRQLRELKLDNEQLQRDLVRRTYGPAQQRALPRFTLPEESVPPKAPRRVRVKAGEG